MNAPVRYVALGDSFTAGPVGSTAPSFADRLAALLREANPQLEYMNLAVPGARSMDVARDQLPVALSVGPDVVTIVCGGNDALLAVRPDVGAHMTALDRALGIFARTRPHVVVATATTPDPGRFLRLRPRSASRITRAMERINEGTRAAAARHGVPCLDIASHPQALARVNYARDGYHPAPEAVHRAALAFGSLIGLRLGIQLDTQEVI